MLDYKLIVTAGQFRWILCAGGISSRKIRDQPQDEQFHCGRRLSLQVTV